MTNSESRSRREFIGTVSIAAAAATVGSFGAVVPRAVEAASAPATIALPTIGCFKGADLVALAAAEAASGKSVMTPSNMNSALPPPNHQHFEPVLKDLRANPSRFFETKSPLRIVLSNAKPQGPGPFSLTMRSSPQGVDLVVAANGWEPGWKWGIQGRDERRR